MSTSQHISVHIEAFTTRGVTEGNTKEVSDLVGETEAASMDGLESVTYFIAGLGVIVLSLCVIVAGLLIYQYCRRSKGGQYTQLEAGQNGVVPSGYTSLVSSPDPGPGNQDQVHTLDETKKKSKKSSKKFPAVKMRLFRQNSSARRKSKIEFDAADFDVPAAREAPSRVKRVAFNTRISRSEWDIYDSRAGGDIRDEIEMLLTRNSKDLSIRSKSPVAEEDFKSQYFDALETLSEDEDEEDTKMIPKSFEGEDSEYEDIEDEEKRVKAVTKKPQKVMKKLNLKTLPRPVQRRVKAMKNLLIEQKKIESEMYKDIHKLEGYFYKMHRNKNYNERQKLVEGELCQSTIMEEEEEEENQGDEPRNEIDQQGIPGFWLKVLLNSKNLSQIVQATDVPVLSNLMDIRVFNFENPTGFRLVFTFRPNDYFVDLELTKDYFLKIDPDEDDDPLTFEGPEVIGCQGCKIHWKKQKNLTIRPIKRVQNHKIVTKWARKNSFFNFFQPPKIGSSSEDVHHLKRRELLEAHFQLGLFFKEQIIPRAFLFFTRAGYDGEMSRAGSRVRLRRSTRCQSSGHKTPARKISDDTVLNGSVTSEQLSANVSKTDQNQNQNFQPMDLKEEMTTVKSNGSVVNGNGMEENVIRQQVMQENDNTEILDSVSEVEDSLPGRYLMESSEKFDDFMKALGVGMIKRKLANSVVPINEIEISESGVYTIRTVTTVRTTEISFRLNEPFTEDTIDGRKTTTTPTRVGNFLKLDQKGDKTRGEKDSVMTRDLDGDTITMELIVDNVVCTRIYKRIKE